jgi:hypothetical protein
MRKLGWFGVKIEEHMSDITISSSPGAAPRSGLLQELRQRHPRFVYERYSVSRVGSELRVQFRFRLEPDIEFTPETTIEKVDWAQFEEIPRATIDNLFFHLGLVEMLSYWKAACSPEIVVRAGALSPEQIAWWADLLRNGMGEYFYVNQIDFRAPDLVRIISAPRAGTAPGVIPRSEATRDLLLSGSPQEAEKQIPRSARNDIGKSLVLTSGGKDSVVTLETLRAAGQRFDCLLLNPTEAALAISRKAGCTAPIIVRRTIDARLLLLNAAGYLNGHTPFSALLAILGTTVAALGGYRGVIVSNERSAEEGTVEYLGAAINHQYSKTFQFETAFREYSQKYLSPDIEYFSLLRPLYEIQIARLFAKYPQYFSLFRSCNRGQATNSWCGRCPKCLFVYTVLYPFVEREQMLRIFGSDLYQWDRSVFVLRELLGLDSSKPFECVGTKEETLAALHLCVEKYNQQSIPLPASLATIEQNVLSSRRDLPELAQRVLSSWTDQHLMPPSLAAMVKPSGSQ